MERLVASPAFQFKGSGWCLTDSAQKAAAVSDSKGAHTTGSDAAKSEKTGKESKEPAPAKETKKAQKES